MTTPLNYNNRFFDIPEQYFGRDVRLRRTNGGSLVQLSISADGTHYVEVPVTAGSFRYDTDAEWTGIIAPATFGDGTRTGMTLFVKKTREESLRYLQNMRDKIQIRVTARWQRSAVHSSGLIGSDAVYDRMDREELSRLDSQIERFKS